MRYEVDDKNEIVDLYITDESGREHHDGLTFKEAEELFEEILWCIKNPQI